MAGDSVFNVSRSWAFGLSQGQDDNGGPAG